MSLNISIEVNSVDPDQTAPTGEIIYSRRLQQTTLSDAFFLGALSENVIEPYSLPIAAK